MGVIVSKAPGSSVVAQTVKVMKKIVEGFMKFADAGFRYIDVPMNHGVVMPKKNQ